MNSQKASGQSRRKTVKFLISVLSVLILDFGFGVLNKVITTWKGDFNNYWLTAFGMITIVVLLLPAVSIPDILNRVAEWVLSLTVKIGRIFLHEWIVIFLVFFLVLFMLFIGFYWLWFNKLIFVNGVGDAVNFDFLKKIQIR